MSDVCVKYIYKKDICYSYYEYIFVIVTEAKVMKSSSSMEIVIIIVLKQEIRIT